VSSEAHMLCSNLNVNDLNFERESAVGSMTSPFRFYSPAKLCNILFTNELAVKLKSLGENIYFSHFYEARNDS